MKNLKWLAFISLFMISIASYSQARIGAGLGYASEVNSGGILLNGEFFLKKKLAIAPSFMFYFQDFWEVNGNLNFMLSGNDAVLPYAIAGLNVISSNGNTEMGINAGIGANFDIGGKLRPFGEARYVLGELDQLIVGGGIKFPIF